LPDKEPKMPTLRLTHTLTLAAALCGLAFLALIGGAAEACEAAKAPGPYGKRVALENCAARIQHDPWSGAYLSEVEELGNGFVVQTVSDGMACSSNEIDRVVQDCSSGRVAVFGQIEAPFWSPRTDENGVEVRSESELLMDRIRSAAAAGTPMSVDEILTEARSRKIQFVLESTTEKLLAINGHAFPIKCGCRTFYPGS
jgi:hypothetical protein